MRAIRVDPGRDPIEVQIGNEVEDIDAVVSGYPKQFHHYEAENGKRRTIYYATAEGARLKLLPNRDFAGTPIFGSILVVAHDVASAAQVEMTDQEVENAIRSFDAWSKIPLPVVKYCPHVRTQPVTGGNLCLDCGKWIPVPLR